MIAIPILPLLLLVAENTQKKPLGSALRAANGDDVVEWEKLPAIPYRINPSMTQTMHNWARRQVISRKCNVRRLIDGRPALQVEVAVLIDTETGVRTTVPRAMGCPSVEQYAAGLVAGFSRNNLTQRAAAGATWYRATVTFAWRS